MIFSHFHSKSIATNHIFNKEGGCMRFIKGLVVLGAAVSFCFAQITGTVTDSLNPGVPVIGAAVSLKASGGSATTDMSGNFSLSSTGIIENASQEIAVGAPTITAQGAIQLNLQQPSRVEVKTFSADRKSVV
jgi:hypothetical protein